MLRLLDAVTDQQAPPPELGATLRRLAVADAGVAAESTYRKLLGWSRARRVTAHSR